MVQTLYLAHILKPKSLVIFKYFYLGTRTMLHGKNPIILPDDLQQYRKMLHRKFCTTRSTEGFISLIGDELEKYGITVWAYTPLEVSDSQVAGLQMGTIEKSLIDVYVDESLHAHDLVFQHIREAKTPMFQSTIADWTKRAPCENANIKGFNKIVDRNEKYGMGDTYNIPLSSTIDGKDFIFCVTSVGGKVNKFRSYISNNSAQIQVIGMVVNEVGIKLHPTSFTPHDKSFFKIKKSKPLLALRTITELDLTIDQTAKTLGISASTVNKHLISIRQTLDAKNNHIAYATALDQGYFQK
ncbi:autoinducer binding domain-containing protein [bacterium AH-315-K03]|nr:autoinducer binding domain-containing protein [bacterium AH-315-K03]